LARHASQPATDLGFYGSARPGRPAGCPRRHGKKPALSFLPRAREESIASACDPFPGFPDRTRETGARNRLPPDPVRRTRGKLEPPTRRRPAFTRGNRAVPRLVNPPGPDTATPEPARAYAIPPCAPPTPAQLPCRRRCCRPVTASSPSPPTEAPQPEHVVTGKSPSWP
jgi:hypothetical protein